MELRIAGMTRLAFLCAVTVALLLPLSACGSDSSDSDASASFTAIPTTITENAESEPSSEQTVEISAEEKAPAEEAPTADDEGLIADALTVCGEVQGSDGGSVEVVAVQDNTTCLIGVETMAYYIMAIKEGRVEGSAMMWTSDDGWYCFRDQEDPICSSTDLNGVPAKRGSGVVMATRPAN